MCNIVIYLNNPQVQRDSYLISPDKCSQRKLYTLESGDSGDTFVVTVHGPATTEERKIIFIADYFLFPEAASITQISTTSGDLCKGKLQ